MLINRVSEGSGGAAGAEEGDEGEYRAADELFELMARDHGHSGADTQSLSASDLVILYKNIDVGTKLISDATARRRRTPNQHVETIVYNDDRESDDSDISEIHSNEDLQDIFAINKERIDLINNLSCGHHPLCHKFGDIEIQTSNFSSSYDSHFLFKDPYIKQQLKNLSMLPDTLGIETMLPPSLLDYICCKRLEDNYNFYMDNVIRYVQHTIEQLKRISNGDYLTDRAKEKWREVEKDSVNSNTNGSKVLATSVSIPIHVMGKVDGNTSMWEDIVHSEVDVRSLSKILEKRIIIEVPKLICGSYKLFSERSADSLIISCKKDSPSARDQGKEESRVDVVFQLKPSRSGHVISNINSIMILQKIPSVITTDPNRELKEITFGNYDKRGDEHPRIVEVDENYTKEELENVVKASSPECDNVETANIKPILDTSDAASINDIDLSSSQSSTVDNDLLKRKMCMKTLKSETNFTFLSPDELRCTIRRLNMQTPVLEETEDSSVSKKRSPTRVRIKSPYENSSYSIEEKKRKKLLEIREKREKKKIALSESCKITKHKYGKGVAVTAQPSSSVTKLSITNKSFYNSIYGENINHECFSKKANKLQKRELSEKGPRKDESENGALKSSVAAFEGDILADGNTETIVQMQENLDLGTCLTPLSGISNYNTDISTFSHLTASSATYSSSDDESNMDTKGKRDEDNIQEVVEGDFNLKDPVTYQSTCIIVPTNTPKETDLPSNMQDVNKKTITVECRKSIDKIYDLLKNLGNRGANSISNTATQYAPKNSGGFNIDGRHSSSIQVSDSGTSVKHHIVSSNPSTYSFGKNKNIDKYAYNEKRKKQATAALVPKVMISTKPQATKVDSENNRLERKRIVTSPALKVPDNPLKAISQLLHEFSNVQKTRYKTHKKNDYVIPDGKAVSRQGTSKKSKQELSNKDPGLLPLKLLPHKERRSRLSSPQDGAQISHHVNYVDDKYASKHTKRNISDVIDEAKEARGEAVRGPSKPYSRINSLAQPKKYYVQAHIDEYQNKYTRNTTTSRLQRGSTSAPLVEKQNTNTSYLRNKRKVADTASMPLAKPVSVAPPPLDKVTRPRRSASNSPVRKRAAQPVIQAYTRQINAPKSPDLKKKMVAVESYVKSHYGHVPIDTTELKSCEIHKSRVPLIPNDIELASLTSSPTVEESTALGKKLHHMVDTMINTKAPLLTILAEGKESASKLNDCLNKLSTNSLLKIEEPKSESDYPVDIFEDKSILTAVSCIPKGSMHEDKVIDETNDTVESYDMQSLNSATEMQKLENALYQRMSVGAFPKRLRIKNLTLTPKQSLQQVIVLQSGDASSLLVKSSLSQHQRRADSTTNSLTAIKPLAALSNTNVNWGFTNIPLQVATIGYAFPKFQATECGTLSPCVQMLMKNPTFKDDKIMCKCNKTSQCFKGVHTESCIEQATQVNISLSICSSSNIITNTFNGNKKNEEHLNVMNNSGNNHDIIMESERVHILDTSDKVQPQKETLKCIPANLEVIKTVEDVGTAQSETNKREEIKTLSQKDDFIDNSKPLTQKDDCIDNSKLLEVSLENSNEAEPKTSQNIDHCTSLDILMGLLNEIRKITGESTQTNNEKEHEHSSKDLQVLLNNAATHESSIDNYCRDIASVSSLQKFNQLNSKTSIFSFEILKDEDRVIIKDKENPENIENVTDAHRIVCCGPKNKDKEVNVAIDKQFVNRLTDAPSRFFPITINHSTNFTDADIEIFSVPSTQSVYSFAKYETQYCKSTMLDMSDQKKENQHNIVCNVISADQDSMELSNIFNDKEDEKVIARVPVVESIKIETISVMTKNLKCARKLLSSHPCLSAPCDPLFTLKRDLLVTVYSVLVFTVFAALSFPKLFFRIEM